MGLHLQHLIQGLQFVHPEEMRGGRRRGHCGLQEDRLTLLSLLHPLS